MQQRSQSNRQERLVIFGLSAVSLLIFGATVWRRIAVHTGDYKTHIEFAVQLAQENRLASAHFLFQALLVALTRLLPSISYDFAAWLVCTTAYLCTVIILYVLVRPAIRGTGFVPAFKTAACTLALMMLAPINLFTLLQLKLYFGYIVTSVAHNPTITLLRPLALLLFVFVVAVLQHRVRFTWRTVAAGIVLVLLSLQAKPNYVLILLPALLVVVAYRLLRRDYRDLKTITVAFIIPMVVILGIQYVVQYLFVRTDGGGIIFAPLATMTYFNQTPPEVVGKFFLSILFPLVVYMVYWRQSVRDFRLNFAWLAFLMGAVQMYFLAESGINLQDGNFWWSAQIGLFVLFVVSTLFVLEHARQESLWRSRVSLAVFVLHLCCGGIFMFMQFWTNSPSAIW